MADMNDDTYFRIKIVLFVQRLSWLGIVAVFTVASVLYALGISTADLVAAGGMAFLLLMVAAKIVLFAEQFRRARLYRFWLLSYLLIVMLLLTYLIKYVTDV